MVVYIYWIFYPGIVAVLRNGYFGSKQLCNNHVSSHLELVYTTESVRCSVTSLSDFSNEQKSVDREENHYKTNDEKLL